LQRGLLTIAAPVLVAAGLAVVVIRMGQRPEKAGNPG
jgi:hypothetical protein